MYNGLKECMDAFLDRRVVEVGIPGIDCSIWKDHKEIYRHAAGYIDMENKVQAKPDTLYKIFSATKPVTAAALLQLAERGLIHFNNPLEMYLPEFADMNVRYATFSLIPAKEKIKLYHLMTHTSGLNYDASFNPDTRKVLEARYNCSPEEVTNEIYAGFVASQPLSFEPGTHWEYGANFEVLGRLIEVVSGKTFSEYLKENIFEPLDMHDTWFDVPEEEKGRIAPRYAYDIEKKGVISVTDKEFFTYKESAGAGIHTTVDDYTKFADAMACGGVGANGRRILSEASIRLLCENRLNDDQLTDFHRMKPEAGMGFGLGVSTVFCPAASNTLAPSHSFAWGGYGGCMNHFDPENRISFFVSQHALASPKDEFVPYMMNILYSHL